MLEFIVKNFKTLDDALGNEPIGQILGNSLRKVFGIKPVLKNMVSYENYFKLREQLMLDKDLNLDLIPEMAIVLVANSNTTHFLTQCYQSIQKQSLPAKEIILVCDNPEAASLINVERHYRNLKDAFQDIASDYICLVHNPCGLYPAFLHEVALHISAQGKPDILYTCHDYIEANGKRNTPQFKPQLNVDLLCASNYIGQNIIVRRQFGDAMDWFHTNSFPSAYVYDFLLRSVSKAARIQRVSEVLYGRLGQSAIEEADTGMKRALQQYIARSGWKADIADGLEEGTMRVQRQFQEQPVVSIIIPYRDKVQLLKQCVESILQKTSYQNYEIILVDNGSQDQETIQYATELTTARLHVHYLRLDVPFNFSRINNEAVKHSSGDFLLFLNNDTQVINRDWLGAMVKELQRPEVGAVGAKLLYEDGTVQHAGVLYGVGHIAGHSFRSLEDEEGGHMQRANITQEYLAVTGACLMTKNSLFQQVGGFDEVNLQIAYNDIDYCLSIHQLGYKVIYTPYAKLYHYESKSRVSDLSDKEVNRYNKECIFMEQKWNSLYKMDPFFHPHLDDRKEDFRLRGNA